MKVKPPKKKPPKNKNAGAERKEAALKSHADFILAKRTADPYYRFTSKEQKILRRVAVLKEKKRLAEVKEKSKSMRAANKKAGKRRRVKNTLPKSVQDVIPYVADFEDGIFELEKGLYSKLYIIEDVNYQTASQEKQIEIFATYAELLNAFDEDTKISIYVDNRVISKNEQERRIFYQLANDGNDRHRVEYNRIMKRQIEAGRNEMVQAKYISATIEAETFAEAASRFHKIDNEIENELARLGSSARYLTTDERLEILHDKFRKGHEGDFKIDFDVLNKQGISSKDYIAPASVIFENKHFMIDDEYYRVMYLNNLPNELADNFFGDFVDNNFPLTAVISVVPIAQPDAIRTIERQKTGMEANIMQAQKKAAKNGYSPELAVSQKLKNDYSEAEELYDDMTRKAQKMFLVTVMVMFSAPTIEELDERGGILNAKARRITAQLQPLTCRQTEGLRCCLPMGVPAELSVDRALTSESTATFIPFSCQEISQRDGFYYGINSISRHLIMVNRVLLRTPSGFILGTSGSGKTFAIKREILNVLLKDGRTTILLIDPENEYSSFVKNFGGEVITISADSSSHINPMEMNADYGLDEDDVSAEISLEDKKEKALRKKSDYLMSIINSMLSTEAGSTLKPQQKTFIDRCVKVCYKKYLDNDFDPCFLPTMKDLQAEFLRQLYKRGRKYGLVITGITQNIEDLLKSDTGRGMVSNSEFLLLLKQAHEDIKILAPMLRMSESQCWELERAEVGSGLLKAGTVIIPFKDKFPQESYLYKLMSSNFNERAKYEKSTSH